MFSADQAKSICRATGATDIKATEPIQSLWSGYGQITRATLVGGNVDSVIVKQVHARQAGQQPRGWNTDRSHQRKVQSYRVESNWYQTYAPRLSAECRIAKPLLIRSSDDGLEHWFVIEDLDGSGYPRRLSTANIDAVKLGLSWLANFHSVWLGTPPDGLWPRGTYWHLATRPDELAAMPDDHPLKQHAGRFDAQLAGCEFQTLVHGDAKIANFCFNPTLTKIAAVDFQYVGGGCGVQDVAYLIGSCLDENACETHETALLDHYFDVLEQTLDRSGQVPAGTAKRVGQQWRSLYPVAWADFNRFLIGWCPGHHKLHRYSRQMTDRALRGGS